MSINNPDQVARHLRRDLLRADQFDFAGPQNNDPENVLSTAARPSLFDAPNNRWLGLAQQFVKDANRQTVVAETVNHAGVVSRRPLGHSKKRNDAPPLGQNSLDAKAKHLFKICDGDVRWRFQATQILNQTLPNAMMAALQGTQSLMLGNRGPITLGMSHESWFDLRRRSHTHLQIIHTSVWRPRQDSVEADDPPQLPFYIDHTHAPHRFSGSAQQVVSVTLLRPLKPALPPRLKDISVEISGAIAPIF